MLTEADKEFIRNNRSELLVGRTTPVTLIHRGENGRDPYTGEPIVTETTETIEVVWKEYSSIANGDRDVIGGVELLENDVKMTVDYDVVLSDVRTAEKDGVAYSLVTIDEKGLGGTNRYECVVRQVT